MSSKKMDPVKKQRYIQHPKECPYCGASLAHSSAGMPDIQYSQVSVRMGCDACKNTWTDVYLLFNVIEDS